MALWSISIRRNSNWHQSLRTTALQIAVFTIGSGAMHVETVVDNVTMYTAGSGTASIKSCDTVRHYVQ